VKARNTPASAEQRRVVYETPVSTIVRLLIAFESLLIEEGLLPSDFTYLIGRPRLV